MHCVNHKKETWPEKETYVSRAGHSAVSIKGCNSYIHGQVTLGEASLQPQTDDF